MEMELKLELELPLRVLCLAGCKLMAGGQQHQQLQQPKQTCSKCKQSQKPMASRWRCRCRCRRCYCCCTCCHYLSCICPGKRMATSAIYPPFQALLLTPSASLFCYHFPLFVRAADSYSMSGAPH